MTILTTTLLVLALAWANGANDIAKGVATLVGNGTARARQAVLWGALWTMLGGLAALLWGAALIQTFGSSFLTPGIAVDPAFVSGTLVGAAGWVLLATRVGLPVSTTHALLGGLVGAVLAAAGPQGLQLATLSEKAMLPLLLSPLLAIALCAALLLGMRQLAERLPSHVPGCCEVEEWRANPFVCAQAHGRDRPSPRTERLWIALHWLSGGLISFARALNDVPKIAAFLVLALALTPEIPAEVKAFGASGPIVLVTVAMGGGALWGGFRVLGVLAHRVTPLDTGSGLAANLGTSLLVLGASPLGLPVSTTHVSTGALMGVRWTDRVKPREADALKLVLYGWLITFPVAAVLASAGLWLFQMTM